MFCPTWCSMDTRQHWFAHAEIPGKIQQASTPRELPGYMFTYTGHGLLYIKALVWKMCWGKEKFN